MYSIDKLKGLFSSGKIGRRDFIQGVVALGATITAATSMSSSILAATPKKGGTLRLAMSSGTTTDILDMSVSTGATSELVHGYAIYNNLVELGADGSVIPELAESVESDDAKTWRFKVRKGVEWHNGKSLDVNDLACSINYHRGEDSKSSIKGQLSEIADVRQDGDYLVIELQGSNSDFPVMLSDYHAPIQIGGSDGKLVNPTAGIGTAGYVLKEYNPGVSASFERNPNYWKTGAAHFDAVETTIVGDATARQQALVTDQVDCIDDVSAPTAGLLSRNQKLELLAVTGTMHRVFAMRLDTPPFDNNDVRLALKFAARRQEMVDKVLLGYGQIGNDHSISPTQKYFNTDLAQREFDADKAKFHWGKTGLGDTPITCHASGASLDGSVDVALLLQASAKECGINLEVKKEPNDGYWSNIWNKPGIGMCTSYWSGRPTPDWMFSTCCIAASEWNDMAWKGTPAADRFNELMVAAKGELDDKKRHEMYFECQKLMNEDGGYITWSYGQNLSAHNKRLAHPEKVAGNWHLDGCKITERWWFA